MKDKNKLLKDIQKVESKKLNSKHRLGQLLFQKTHKKMGKIGNQGLENHQGEFGDGGEYCDSQRLSREEMLGYHRELCLHTQKYEIDFSIFKALQNVNFEERQGWKVGCLLNSSKIYSDSSIQIGLLKDAKSWQKKSIFEAKLLIKNIGYQTITNLKMRSVDGLEVSKVKQNLEVGAKTELKIKVHESVLFERVPRVIFDFGK